MILPIDLRYLSAVFLFLVSGAIQADVPYVFKDGDTIRAEEINENFSFLNSAVDSSSGEGDNTANLGGSENYTYERINLEPGQEIEVLGQTHRIRQLDTLGFKTHKLFTIKFPTSAYLPYTSERRDGGANWGYGYNNEISGYPANINVFVGQYHRYDDGIYNTYFEFQVQTQILIDETTRFFLWYTFDEEDYWEDLRRASGCGNTTEPGCGVETEDGDNFSGLIDQRESLARKARREVYVQELFTLLDHIVISEKAED